MFHKLKLSSKFILFNIGMLFLFYILAFFAIRLVMSSALDKKIESFRAQIISEKKSYLKDVVFLGYNVMNEAYENYFEGSTGKKITEDEAKKKVMDEIKKLRYADQVGYFWINDMGKPYPTMIMHPISPELDGKVLDDPKYNVVGKEKKNLFAAFVEAAETPEQGGFVQYIWPKPAKDGLTTEQPKLSYVKLFKPWNWIVGSGIYLDDVETLVQAERKANIVHNTEMFNMLTLVLLIFLVLMSPAIFIITRSIFKPLRDTVDVLKDISGGGGDLTKRIPFHFQDEIGTLASEFNKFMSQLNNNLFQVETVAGYLRAASTESRNQIANSSKFVSEIKTSIQKIDNQTENSTSGIEELTATVEEMSRNIDNIMNSMVRQASAVEEGASSIEEMVRNIDNTASMSKKTQEISNNLNKVSTDGSGAVKTSIQSVKEVADYSQQILKLLGLITNIAKQTNLLAMNAAIEAAHAGEAGKGFAIVADEIRRLSEDTNKNARDIGEVVSSIVMKINESVQLSEKAGVGLDMITAYSQQNVQIISQLNIAMAEQNNGAKEILKATQDMVKITEEVKLAMMEQKSATDEFSSALRNLRDMAIENKGSLSNHFDNFNELLQSIDNIRIKIENSESHSDDLHQLVGQFVIEDQTKTTGNTQTGLKLVE